MATSRLEKVGTIFTRVSGLLKSGAMKNADKPVWYDVYRAFPPALEPRVDRGVDDAPVRQILYEEDAIRAKFYERFRHLPVVDLNDARGRSDQTLCQKFVEKYRRVRSAVGTHDEAEIFDRTVAALAAEDGVDLSRFESKAASRRRVQEGGVEESLKDAFSAAVSGKSKIDVGQLLRD